PTLRDALPILAAAIPHQININAPLRRGRSASGAQLSGSGHRSSSVMCGRYGCSSSVQSVIGAALLSDIGRFSQPLLDRVGAAGAAGPLRLVVSLGANVCGGAAAALDNTQLVAGQRGQVQ